MLFCSVADSANPGDVEAGDMSNYLERIRVLRAKCGFENNPDDAQSGGSRQTVKSTNAPSSIDSNKDVSIYCQVTIFSNFTRTIDALFNSECRSSFGQRL